MIPLENPAFADLQWFNFSPCCSESPTTSLLGVVTGATEHISDHLHHWAGCGSVWKQVLWCQNSNTSEVLRSHSLEVVAHMCFTCLSSTCWPECWLMNSLLPFCFLWSHLLRFYFIPKSELFPVLACCGKRASEEAAGRGLGKPTSPLLYLIQPTIHTTTSQLCWSGLAMQHRLETFNQRGQQSTALQPSNKLH